MLTLVLGLALVLVEPAPGAPTAAPAPMDGRGACFVRAYPGVVCAANGERLTLCNGVEMAWDDGLGK